MAGKGTACLCEAKVLKLSPAGTACQRVGAFVVDAAVAAVLPYGVTWSVAGLQFPAATFSSFLFFLFSFL